MAPRRASFQKTHYIMEPTPQSIALQILYLHGMLEEEKMSKKWELAIWGKSGWMKWPPVVVVLGKAT